MCQGSQGSSMGYGGMGRSSSGPYSQSQPQNFFNPRAGGASPQWNPMQGGMQKPYQPPMSSPNNYQSPPFVPPGADTQGYNPAKDGGASSADPVFQAMGYQNASSAGYDSMGRPNAYGPDQHQPGRGTPNTHSFDQFVGSGIPPGTPGLMDSQKPPMSSPNYESPPIFGMPDQRQGLQPRGYETPPIFNQDIYGQAKPGLQPRGYESPPWYMPQYQGK